MLCLIMTLCRRTSLLLKAMEKPLAVVVGHLLTVCSRMKSNEAKDIRRFDSEKQRLAPYFAILVFRFAHGKRTGPFQLPLRSLRAGDVFLKFSWSMNVSRA